MEGRPADVKGVVISAYLQQETTQNAHAGNDCETRGLRGRNDIPCHQVSLDLTGAAGRSTSPTPTLPCSYPRPL